MIKVLYAVAFAVIILSPAPAVSGQRGQPMNILQDVVWEEMLPIKIASIPIRSGNQYDSPDAASNAICYCWVGPPMMYAFGITYSFWPPSYLAEVVRTPCYYPFIGGEIDYCSEGTGAAARRYRGYGTDMLPTATRGIAGVQTSPVYFSQEHFYNFYVWSLIQNVVENTCIYKESGFDVVYISEVDPTHNDDATADLINPESVLFASAVAQEACVADSIATNLSSPIDPLFWCMGSSGTFYPLSGNLVYQDAKQGSTSLVSRMMFKLSRIGLLCDASVDYCECSYKYFLRKRSWKFYAAKPRREGKAYPTGKSELYRGVINPPASSNPANEFLYVIHKKKACCWVFL